MHSLLQRRFDLSQAPSFAELRALVSTLALALALAAAPLACGSSPEGSGGSSSGSGGSGAGGGGGGSIDPVACAPDCPVQTLARGGDYTPVSLALGGAHVWVALDNGGGSDGALYKIPLEGGDAEWVASLRPANELACESVVTDDAYVYFASKVEYGAYRAIRRAPLDGSAPPVDLVGPKVGAECLAIDEDGLYFTGGLSGIGIFRLAKDGSSEPKRLSDAFADSLQVSQGRLFFHFGTELRSVSTEGGDEGVVAAVQNAQVIAVDESHVYVTNDNDESILRHAHAGGASEVVAADVTRVESLVASGGHLYFPRNVNDPSDNRLLRVSAAGGDPIELAKTVGARHIAVGSAGIYWASKSEAAVRRLAEPPAEEPCAFGSLRCGGACVDVRSDLDHCGACGAACVGVDGGEAACNAGRCSALLATEPSDGLTTPVADATHVYWQREGDPIKRVPLAGGPVETISIAGGSPAELVSVDGDTLYVVLGEGTERALAAAPKAGGAPTTVYDFALGNSVARAVLTKGDDLVLWHRAPSGHSGKLLRMPKSGGGVAAPLVAENPSVDAVTADADRLYFMGENGAFSVAFDGSGLLELASSASGNVLLATKDHLFVGGSPGGGSSIQRTPLPAGGPLEEVDSYGAGALGHRDGKLWSNGRSGIVGGVSTLPLGGGSHDPVGTPDNTSWFTMTGDRLIYTTIQDGSTRLWTSAL